MLFYTPRVRLVPKLTASGFVLRVRCAVEGCDKTGEFHAASRTKAVNDAMMDGWLFGAGELVFCVRHEEEGLDSRKGVA